MNVIPDPLVHLVGTVLVALIGGVIRDLRKSRVAFRQTWEKKLANIERRLAYVEGKLGI